MNFLVSKSSSNTVFSLVATTNLPPSNLRVYVPLEVPFTNVPSVVKTNVSLSSTFVDVKVVFNAVSSALTFFKSFS